VGHGGHLHPQVLHGLTGLGTVSGLHSPSMTAWQRRKRCKLLLVAQQWQRRPLSRPLLLFQLPTLYLRRSVQHVKQQWNSRTKKMNSDDELRLCDVMFSSEIAYALIQCHGHRLLMLLGQQSWPARAVLSL